MGNAVTLILKGIPDMSIGGNARYAHWAQRYKAQQEDKLRWFWLIREALEGQDTPTFHPPVHLSISITWPASRRRDPDNIIMALKPLIDAMRALGMIEDDNADALTVTLGSRAEKGKRLTALSFA